jgi:hypothetical protein
MGLDYGSLGRELWLGFFSVVGQSWTLQASVRSPPLCLTLALSLICSWCQREFDY